MIPQAFRDRFGALDGFGSVEQEEGLKSTRRGLEHIVRNRWLKPPRPEVRLGVIEIRHNAQNGPQVALAAFLAVGTSSRSVANAM
jgi:hypothetical protein